MFRPLFYTLAGLFLVLTMGLLPLEMSVRAAEPAPPDNPPIPMIDPQGHKSIIRGIAFLSPTQLVSVGDDKTIRIWDTRRGGVVRTLRGQSDEGRIGALFSMALSPDKKQLAVGGFTSIECPGPCGDIRIHDLASGEITTLLKQHERRVLGLAFSRDGRMLLSGSRDHKAVIWNLENNTVKHVLVGHEKRVKAVGFSADGQYGVTGSWDNTLRVWKVSDGSLHTILQGHAGPVMALAVSPNGFTIASGSDDKTIRIWNGETGQLLRTLEQGTEVASLSFSPDGAKLLSGVANQPANTHVWSVASGKKLLSHRHDNSVIATAISPDGQLAATAGGNRKEVHVWSLATGRMVKAMAGVGATNYAVSFSKDGRRIAWGRKDPCPDERLCPNRPGLLEFELELPGGNTPLGEPRKITRPSDFARVRTRYRDMSLRHRKGKRKYFVNLDLKTGDRLIASIRRDRFSFNEHTAYGFARDGKTVISAGHYGRLTSFDLKGEVLREFVGHTASVWDFSVSPDNRLLASVGSDQTLRLWNLASGELLVSLFHASNGEWVMWTPQGYYSASVRGDRLVGWQINRSPGKRADFVTAGQLKKHLYNPEIVRRAIVEASARKVAPALRASAFTLGELKTRALPAFKIVSPLPDSRHDGSDIALNLQLEKQAKDVDKIEILVNGVHVETRKMRGFAQVGAASQVSSISVPLTKGENNISVIMHNKTGRTQRQIVVHSQAAGGLDKRGTLYLLAIGVDKYPQVFSDLQYAGADARAFLEKVQQKTGVLHSGVKTMLITNDTDAKPTKNEIEDALGLFFADSKPQDTIVVFIAGHGVNDGRHYYYLPTNARRKNGKWVPSSVVKWRLLQDTLQEAKGNRIMFVDTCHAAGSFNAGRLRGAANENIFVLTATTKKSAALEIDQYGHGVFTHALIKGLDGKADDDADGLIYLPELANQISREVKRLTRNQQKPRSFLLGADDIVFAKP